MNDESEDNDLSSFGNDDSEVKRLLVDAYGAPAPPASLLQRLDLLITQEWGHSPELVTPRPSVWQRSMRKVRPWNKVIRVAACFALVIGTLVMFGRASPAYAWSSMVRAIEQQGIVQLSSHNVQRWLSLSDGVVSERSDKALTLLDADRHVVLERNSSDPYIRRRPASSQWMVPDHDRLVLAFLLGDPASTENAERLRRARLIHERWESVDLGDRKVVALFVRWKTDSAEQLDFHLTIDPDTHLPIDCRISGDMAASTTSLTCSYPTAIASEMRARDFPNDLRVIDVVEASRSADSSTNIASNNLSRDIGQSELKTEGSAAASSDGGAVPPEVRSADASAIPAEWKPIQVTSQSRMEVVQRVDLTLDELWQTNHVEPAPSADEEELLRRVFLDLCGRTPTIHEIRTFLADKSPDRYERLVDRLLQHRDHASHLATIWRSFLIPEGVDLTAFGGVDGFDRWLADRFGRNDSYDSVVRELLLAEGRLSRSGPLLFYSAAKLDPEQLAARTARVFLGMRLECAQCHDHPFEPWTQEDFWGFAAFFAQISRPQGDLRAASTVMQVRDVDHGEVKLPRTDTVVAPHFLNGDRQIESQDRGPGIQPKSRRQQLARWLTAAENPYFSRATANRVWSTMFGKGIVDPVDDLGIRHPPKSTQLLELLAGHFVDTKFDLRELFRTIALSRAYRLSSGADTDDPRRAEWFAQMNVKTFSAEQVFDCMAVATMLGTKSTADPLSFNLVRSGNTDRDQFLRLFRTPGGNSTEYLGGIPQALTLMNGTLIDNATSLSKSGVLKSLEAPFFTNKQRVEILYLAVLSRHPRPTEWNLLDQYISESTPPTELFENLSDLLWALLNSAEFTMNH